MWLAGTTIPLDASHRMFLLGADLTGHHPESVARHRANRPAKGAGEDISAPTNA